MIHPQPTSVLLLLHAERTRARSPNDDDAMRAPRRSLRRVALARIGRVLISLGSRLTSGQAECETPRLTLVATPDEMRDVR